MQSHPKRGISMKKYVFIMLAVVCCWIFCISVDVFAAGHGGGHGRGGGGGRGGYYVGGYYGGGNRHHRNRCFF